jgi:hypothetical protein
VGGNVPIDSEAILVTDFVNLKSVQSFEGAHKNRMYMHVFIGMSAHTCMCMSIYVCTVFLKKRTLDQIIVFICYL